MKCLCNQKKIIFGLSFLFSFLICFIFCSGSASAANDAWSTGIWCTSGYYDSFHSFEYIGRYDLPHDAIPYNPACGGWLYGVRVEQAGNFGDSSKKNNIATIRLTLYQSLNSSGVNSLTGNHSSNGYIITTDDIMYTGACSFTKYQQKAVWTCRVPFPDYKSAYWVGVDLGSIYQQSPPSNLYDGAIGYFNDDSMTGSLQYFEFHVDVESSSDPVVSGQEALIDETRRTNELLGRSNDLSEEQIASINNQTIAINSQTEQLLTALSEQTEQEHSDYEAEKEEEAQREASAQDSAEDFAGVFNFQVLNPFGPIFALFGTGGSCVDIPIIAEWLHLDYDEVCPMFPAEVRQVLTPVIGISSMMIIFGFVVRWLQTGFGDNGIDVKGGYN